MKENKGQITNSIPEGDGICYGYHVNHITKGILGYLSKIQEELDEAKDFESQNNPVGVLLELSDLLGAVDAYLKNRHSSISLWDLVTMFEATHRAFATGERSKGEEIKIPSWEGGVYIQDPTTGNLVKSTKEHSNGEWEIKDYSGNTLFKWDTQGFKYPGVTIEDTFTDAQAVTISSNGSGEQSWTSGQNRNEQSSKVVKNTVDDLISPESVKQVLKNYGRNPGSIQEALWICNMCGEVENVCRCLNKGKIKV